MKRPPLVFVLSALPPPPGGVAVHTERLCRLLHAQGYCVEAFEMHTKRAVGANFPFAYHHGRGVCTMFLFLVACFARRPDIIHIHLSTARRVFLLFPVIVALSALFRLILTVHSGSFSRRVAEATGAERWWLVRGFRSVNSVIAVSRVNQEVLIREFGVAQNRIALIPAFLRPSAPETCSPSGSRPQRRVILASGYATPTYFWEGLLEALQGLAMLDELVLAFYNQFDQPYFDNLVERTRRSGPFAVRLCRDLSADAFQRELAHATLFVRPTLTDGDSVALREALALGTRVVASDAVPRPPGCVLFRSRDVGDLREKLLLVSKMPVRSTPPDDCDFAQPILALYERVLAGGAG